MKRAATSNILSAKGPATTWWAKLRLAQNHRQVRHEGAIALAKIAYRSASLGYTTAHCGDKFPDKNKTSQLKMCRHQPFLVRPKLVNRRQSNSHRKDANFGNRKAGIAIGPAPSHFAR